MRHGGGRAGWKRCGQVTIEYTWLFAVVIAAILVMLIIGRRHIAGKWREALTSMSETVYDPQHTTSDTTTITSSNVTTTSELARDQDVGGKTVDVLSTKTIIHNDTMERGGWEIVDEVNKSSLWE